MRWEVAVADRKGNAIRCKTTSFWECDLCFPCFAGVVVVESDGPDMTFPVRAALCLFTNTIRKVRRGRTPPHLTLS